MNKKLPAVILLCDACHGIYIPSIFIESIEGIQEWKNISNYDKEQLKNSDNENYWHSWDNVLSKAEFTKDGNTWRLHQDGDLWLLCYELMTDEQKQNFGFNDE